MADPSTPLPALADAADEATTLRQFLDYHRTVLIRKTEGITTEQANRTVPPSDLTLAGLVRHLTFVEDYWANDVFAGREAKSPWSTAPWDRDPDWEMTSAGELDIAALRDAHRAAWAEADAIYAEAPSLDRLAIAPNGPDRANRSLRWILVHLIEEYARHVGHADFLRQAIDGSTGD